MNEPITKEDLKKFKALLLNDIANLLKAKVNEQVNGEMDLEWIRSKAIRHIMGISSGTIQNLRITGKIRFKKIMGSYYYNKSDIAKLFNED